VAAAVMVRLSKNPCGNDSASMPAADAAAAASTMSRALIAGLNSPWLLKYRASSVAAAKPPTRHAALPA